MARKGRPWRDHKPPPSGPVWGVINGLGSYWALVAAVDLKLFDAIKEIGWAPADEIAAKLELSAEHLAHLMDVMVTMGFLEKLDDRYEITDTAARYLCTDGASSMTELVRISPGPMENWFDLASAIKNGGAASPIDDDLRGFYGPLNKATFATQLRVATLTGFRLGWQGQPGLRVLDLGAGFGPWAGAVLNQSEGARAVLNDWPEIIELAKVSIEERGLSDRVSYLPGDFNTVDLEEDAFDVVALCHVCRTEGPERSPALVERAARALKPGGRLLVADYFADNEKRLNPFGVQMGLTMLANTRNGRAISHEQMHGWLAAAPLESIRLIEPIKFNQVYVATKRGA